MRFVRWRMRGGELRLFGSDVEDGGREWLPHKSTGVGGSAVSLCR